MRCVLKPFLVLVIAPFVLGFSPILALLVIVVKCKISCCTHAVPEREKNIEEMKDEDLRDEKETEESQETLPPCETSGQSWKFPWEYDVGLYIVERGNVIRPVRPESIDPSTKVVVYIHGLELGTTSRGFRETVNSLEVVDPHENATVWIDRGYTVLIFYWNQLSDDYDIWRVEEKLYFGKDSLRWRRRLRTHGGDVEFVRPGKRKTPVSALLAHGLEEVFPRPGQKLWFICHSLGCQLGLEAARIMMREDACPTVARISLIDPYFSPFFHDFPAGKMSSAAWAAQTLETLATSKSLAMETCSSSLVGDGWLGSQCTEQLCKFTFYSRVKMATIPWWNLRLRHILAVHYFFCSIVLDLPVTLQQCRASFTASLSESDLLRLRTEQHYDAERGRKYVLATRSARRRRQSKHFYPLSKVPARYWMRDVDLAEMQIFRRRGYRYTSIICDDGR